MKIIQVLPTLSYGDAVSNDAIAIHNGLAAAGYNVSIYADNIDKRLQHMAKQLYHPLKVNEDDLLIYHKSTGTRLSFELDGYSCKKVMRYHNITPAEFYQKYNLIMYNQLLYGRSGLKHLVGKMDFCLADSEYNKQELVELGYQNISVMPVFIPFDDYKKEPNTEILNRYRDGKVNILFTGRICPNKRHEDIIRCFYYYKKYYNLHSRLIFVGSDLNSEGYSKLLKEYIHELKLEDVIFTGHIPFDQILAYYTLADIFLCMSEHEGFCVPLVESMVFNVPIVAYSSSAIPYTMGDSGIIVKKKDPILIAALMNKLIVDAPFKDAVIKSQSDRLQAYSNEVICAQLLSYIKKIS